MTEEIYGKFQFIPESIILKLLKKIKKLKVEELIEIAERLEIISNRNTSSIKDLAEALNCCNYHFYGNNYQDEICSCNCYCKNCEYIPQDKVRVRMQELATNMTDKLVIYEDEFLDNYGQYIENINIGESDG